MKAIERAAITRILIDLIKADKVIDSREMELYKDLKRKLSLSREDEVEAYNITLGHAIDILKEMDKPLLAELIDVFNGMTLSDGFCAREEALLMLSLNFCLAEPTPECDVISREIEEAWFDERQVLYVESHHAKDVNFAIHNNHRAISRELKQCGLDFVYLPHVLHHYITTPNQLMLDVVTLLSPSLSDSAISGLLTKIKLFKTDTFCIEQLHHKLGFEELGDTPPALLMRISQSKVKGRVVTNFLRIELSAEVLPTVQKIVDTFLSYTTSDSTVISHKKDEKGSFLYNGFYRQIFEILLLQKAVECHLLIDFIHNTISFTEIDVVLSGLHRKEKALYVLFMFEAYNGALRDKDGRIKQNGGINFTPPSTSAQLKKFNARMERLQQKYALIYEAFGGDPESAPDITNSDIRLPMISGIRRAIKRHSEKIYDSQSFEINRDKNGCYSISANPEAFLCKDFTHSSPINFLDSNLYSKLAKLS